MTFKKPEDITYTQMCIYVDENVYKETFNEELVYEYIYHIVLMLAKNAQIFNRHCYYDDFAVYGANRVYMRLTNKNQFELKEDGTPKLEKIKSVLNYARSILYPLKVDFEQSEYCQTISKPICDEDEVDYSFNNVLIRSLDEMTFCEFNLIFDDISKTCRALINTTPFKKNSKEWLNVYTSVMLTLLGNITLTNKRKRRLEHLSETSRITESHIIDAFNEEPQQRPILFHLPASMGDYIMVLSRQLKHNIAKDLSFILNTRVSNDMELMEFSIRDYMEDIEDEYNEYQ